MVTAQVQPKKISSLGGSAYGGNQNTNFRSLFHVSHSFRVVTPANSGLSITAP